VSLSDVLAVIAGVAAIGLVNWWFFIAGREPKVRSDARRR
jgi:hypothetical protein